MALDSGWKVNRYETFVEYVPIDDAREHLLGDECWCQPQIQRQKNMLPVIGHNSMDGRESLFVCIRG